MDIRTINVPAGNLPSSAYYDLTRHERANQIMMITTYHVAADAHMNPTVTLQDISDFYNFVLMLPMFYATLVFQKLLRRMSIRISDKTANNIIGGTSFAILIIGLLLYL